MQFRLLFLFILLILRSNAQNQIDSLGHLSYDVGLTDVWGYEDELGNEYALIGLINGVSIVDASDPSNLIEVYRQEGPESFWRDLKVWGDYAYVTNESDSGLLIIDLSPLPQSSNLPSKYYKGDVGKEFSTAHNIFIDENGIGFVVGANKNNGGVILLDLKTDPLNPTEIYEIDNNYVHDVFVRNDTLITADVGDGMFSIYDISSLTSPQLLGRQLTRDKTTHNVGLSDDGKTVFTTDEVNGGSIGSYDISDMNNIEELDAFKKYPKGFEMPHNVFVKDELLIISYYKEGLVIVDAQRPSNLVELASFDTDKSQSGPNSGGAWGAYPYLSSNRVFVSDMNKGLYVFGYNLSGSNFIEGKVTDLSTGFPLVNVNIDLLSDQLFESTNLNGDYAIGFSETGSKTMVYSKAGYISDTITVSLIANQLEIVDVQLKPLDRIQLELNVNGTGDLSNCVLHLVSDGYEEKFMSNSQGDFVIPNVFVGDFEFYIGKWGYESFCFEDSISNTNTSFTINLVEGYLDDFSSDQGWEVFKPNADAVWERTIPIASFSTTGVQYDPGEDGSDSDCGSYAFCTGIDGYGLPGTSTSNGENYLVSPFYHLSDVNAPSIEYEYWLGFQWNSEDSLKVGLITGLDTIYIESYTLSSTQRMWLNSTIDVNDFISNYSSFKLVFFIEDSGDWNVIDAAIDNVVVSYVNSAEEVDDGCRLIRNGSVFSSECNERISLFDIRGKSLIPETNEINLAHFSNGIYLLKIADNKTQKIIWEK